MKTTSDIKVLLTVFLLLAGMQVSNAQFFKKLKERVKERVEETVNRKVEEKSEQKVEQAIDSVFEIGQKKKKRRVDDEMSDDMDEMEGAEDMEMGSEDNMMSQDDDSGFSFEAYSKYDFIPGEQLLAFEDFSQDEVGDLPARWNTNTSAEVVTVNNQEGQWMQVGKGLSAYVADFIEEVPDNFTLEFDVVFAFDGNTSAYSRRFGFLLSDLENPNYRLDDWQAGTNIFRMNLMYPSGSEYFKRAANSKLNSDSRKEIPAMVRNGFQSGKRIHVAIWRQKTRVRVYVDNKKVFDVPRALEKGVIPKTLRLQSHMSEEGEGCYVSNIRYAVGKPDMRNKLLEEGRLVTYGITFDSGSSQIKPESTGTLKKIAEILNANPSIQVMIVGHTDADGDADYNLKLSKKRAKAVTKALINQFGVANDQLSSDGKGESELIDTGNSSESKAKNRRVEIIKL